jgi:hypothetical protein
MQAEITENVVTEIRTLHAEILGTARMSLEKAIRIGELLYQIKKDEGHGNWLSWLEENLPFSHSTASNYMGCFDRRAELLAKFPTVGNLREAYGLLTSSTAHVSHNSGESEWFTPSEYVEAARRVMGRIDLDPASTETANSVIKAERFYSFDDDGLSKEWHGRIWLNPPYAQPTIEQFCLKVVNEFQSGHIESACVLVNNATETKWFQIVARISNAICFPAGRVRFWSPDKESAPLQGQAVLSIGNSPKLFIQAFKSFGFVVT